MSSPPLPPTGVGITSTSTKTKGLRQQRRNPSLTRVTVQALQPTLHTIGRRIHTTGFLVILRTADPSPPEVP
jgi:hypothetical protein